MAVLDVNSTSVPDPSPKRAPRGHEGGFLHRNGLTIACFALFFAFWFGQSITGWHVYNDDQLTHGSDAIGYAQYLTTGHFIEATFENWESEFLQMFAFILLTAWFVQRGSAESKAEHDETDDAEGHRNDPDAPWPVRRGGAWLKVYEQSLVIAFFVLFILSIGAHAVGGLAEHNAELASHGQAPDSLSAFVTSADFWFQSFQNWQSEFLAVGCFVVLTIFLRQKGSPESKPVYAPHRQTDTGG
jgi:hypothetical protein